MEKVMEKIKNTKLLALISAVCLIASVFLPYVVVEIWGFSESESMINSWEGVVVLIASILNIVILFIDEIKRQIPQLFENDIVKRITNIGSKILTLAPVVIIGLMVLIFHLENEMEFGTSYVHYGFGFWLILIGIAIQIVYTFLHNPVSKELNGNE